MAIREVTAETFKRAVEEIFKQARAAGYTVHVEAECWTDSHCCMAETILDSIGITFYNPTTTDYITVDEDLYEIGRA